MKIRGFQKVFFKVCNQNGPMVDILEDAQGAVEEFKLSTAVLSKRMASHLRFSCSKEIHSGQSRLNSCSHTVQMEFSEL